jgi:hypothetical protein
MADLKLGPSGSQTTLPDMVWPDGSPPDIPYERESSADEVTMLDGGNRVNAKTYTPGTWTLVWDGLTWTDVGTIVGAAAFGSQLAYTNEYTDNTAHNVYVKSLSYSLKGGTAGATKRYVVNLSLREVL